MVNFHFTRSRLALHCCWSGCRKRSPGSTIADFGCGEAKLAATLMSRPSSSVKGDGGLAAPSSSSQASSNAPSKPPVSGFTVHSFDLVAPAGNPYIVSCNMEAVPLASSSIDVAVYCLSLMGVNYAAFLREGARVLKPGGRLLIAEVKSRFATSSSAAGNSSSASSSAPHNSGHAAAAGNKRPRQESSKTAAAAAMTASVPSHHQPPGAGHKRPRHEHTAAAATFASDPSPDRGAAAAAADLKGRASTSAADSGVTAFAASILDLGFVLERRDESNTMFVLLYFRKLTSGPRNTASAHGNSSDTKLKLGGGAHGKAPADAQHNSSSNIFAGGQATVAVARDVTSTATSKAARKGHSGGPGQSAHPSFEARKGHSGGHSAARRPGAGSSTEGPVPNSSAAESHAGETSLLKPCIYKRR